MQLIPLTSADGLALSGRPAQAALSEVIGAIGDARFGQNVLGALNQWMPLAWWSVYTLFEDAPPALHAHGSTGGVPDGTAASWRVYRSSLYRRDATFTAARSVVAQGTTALLHYDASEIPSEHRAAIYSAHGLRERLSIVSGTQRQGLLAVNFYWHEGQGPLSGDGVEAMAQMAQPLNACVQRHIALRAREAAHGDRLAALTQREREVCERLLKGWTQDGIAADLGLTAATIRTYRDRAFSRLGIRYRHELFALMARAHDSAGVQ